MCEAGACVQDVSEGRVGILFTAKLETQWGDTVRVVGSTSELGSWNPRHGISLTTNCDLYPYWKKTVWIPPSSSGWEYKFVVVKSNDSVEWEHGNNHVLAPPTPFPQCLLDPINECTSCAARCPCTTMDTDMHKRTTTLFEVVYDGTSPGDELIVAGDAHTLGNWQPSQGLQLSTCESMFPIWRGSTRLHTRELGFEWKIVCRRANGHNEWEKGDNRQVSIQHSKGQEAEFWLISAIFGGAHKDPVPWQNIAREDLHADALPERYELDSCANTCLADDQHSESSTVSSPVWHTHTSLNFWCGAQQVQKAGGCCEDAYFHGDNALGVAAGCQSFAKYGVDSAAYAAQLMHLAATQILPSDTEATPEASALEQAVAALSHAEQSATAFGASTALVLALAGQTIGVANLGDSGFLLLRRTSSRMTIIERSKGQQHSWNCPYQLLRLPPALAARVPSSLRPDSTLDCEHIEVPVEGGDLVLVFTDGLSDNLYEHELLEVVNRLAGSALEPGCPQTLANELAIAAHQRSLDPNAEAPFMLACCKQGQETFGGRPDDITVVAAWIKSNCTDGVLHGFLPYRDPNVGHKDNKISP